MGIIYRKQKKKMHLMQIRILLLQLFKLNFISNLFVKIKQKCIFFSA